MAETEVSPPFSTQERADILRFLSFPDWRRLAQSIQLGFPAGSQILFLVQSSFELISPEARINVRRDVCELKDIECQKSSARSRFKAIRLGNLYLNPNEERLLDQEMLFWTMRLADDLGVTRDAYSQMVSMGGLGVGVNAKVSGI